MDALIEQCTSEKLNYDKWDLILRICEEYGSTQPKVCLKAICKKIFQKHSTTSLRAITLLDACSKNCGKPFNREIASRDFTQTVKSRFSSLAEIPQAKLVEVFEKWSEEFKADSELALAASLFTWVRSEHPDVLRRLNDDRQAAKSSKVSRPSAAQLQAKEEEELARAIAMSLKESDKKHPKTTVESQQPTSTKQTVRTTPTATKGRVRALYDFEAAEDNELTFKAGELVVLLDDSDENWWRGSNHRGEGLFPAQFVKREQDEEPSAKPSAHTTTEPRAPVVLDPAKLDECLRLISTVDPTGEFRPDPVELPRLEAECNAMAPLVDPELEKVDRRVMMLSELNQRLLDAFQMYHDLMSQAPTMPSYNAVAGGYGMIPTTAPSTLGQYGQQMGYGQQPGASTGTAAYTLPDGTMYQPPNPQSAAYWYPSYAPTESSTKPSTASHQQPYAVSNVYGGTYPQPIPVPPGTVTDPNAQIYSQNAQNPSAQPSASYYYGYGPTPDGYGAQHNAGPSNPDGTAQPSHRTY